MNNSRSHPASARRDVDAGGVVPATFRGQRYARRWRWCLPLVAGLIIPAVLTGGAWLAKTPRATSGQPPAVRYRHVLALEPAQVPGLELAALKSLAAVKELTVFLSARGHCLEAAGRLAEAQMAHAHAHALAPQNPVYIDAPK